MNLSRLEVGPGTKVILAAAMLLGLCVRDATGQLAITEVMSSASTNLGADFVTAGSDFWELTNFGTNTIDLADYKFTDAQEEPLLDLVQPGDPPLLIGSGKSVIFVRYTDSSTNEAQFRAWWGPCLSSDVKVRFYDRSIGFDAVEDGVRLYGPSGTLVDSVDFGIARRGTTFVYDTDSGDFGTYSTLGDCGACQAATADDIGSLGITCGLVDLCILGQPTNLLVCAGTEATFSVRAVGLPRPKYQWFFNDFPIPGATAADFTITNTGPSDEGHYEVQITNGFSTLHTTAAILTVSTNPSAPSIVMPPSDFQLYTGQTARFSVTVCAFPSASYQWLSNDMAIAGATDRILRIPNCDLNMSGTRYYVQIQNSFGSTNACAQLIVTPKPKLLLTEIMARAATNCSAHEDWFELTNQDTISFNLLGYRFSDRNSLKTARVITQPVIVRPDESVIFVERMTSEAFIRWWGADSLPPALKIMTYVGLGFNEQGEVFYLWNAAAENNSDRVLSISYASARPGVSLYFDPDFGVDSELSQGGAFRAAECGDIGSPGYTTNPPPRFVRISRDASSVTLKWRAIEGKSYRLNYKTNLNEASWAPLSIQTATNSVQTATDVTVGNDTQRFYVVGEEP